MHQTGLLDACSCISTRGKLRTVMGWEIHAHTANRTNAKKTASRSHLRRSSDWEIHASENHASEKAK